MTLYLIGLGLCDEKDITLRGLEALRKCTTIYFENYTSLLQCTKSDFEKLAKKHIIEADREQIENKQEEILNKAEKENVAILIIGDPMSATTHINFLIEAKKQNIKCEVIHNASILTAVGITGLQLYKFGKTTSIPFTEKTADTVYITIKENKKNNLHTLVLLDIDPKRNKFLTINEAMDILLKTENQRKEKVITEKTTVIAAARIGCADQTIRTGKVKAIKQADFGKPPFCLIVPANKLHFMEEEALDLWAPGIV